MGNSELGDREHEDDSAEERDKGNECVQARQSEVIRYIQHE